jgi:hypothetical protein
MGYHATMPQGFGSTRSGRPPIKLQTLIDRLVKKKTASVSTREALDAAKVLDTDPRTRVQRYRDASIIGGTMSPVVRAVGRGVEGAVNGAGRGRVGVAKGFVQGLAKTNRGEIARHVTEGVIGGGGVKAVQEGREISRARKKIVEYIGSDKVAELAPNKTLRRLGKLPPIVDEIGDEEI